MKVTINIRGIDFTVDCDYTPDEKPVMYYPDGSGHPGYPPRLDITSINYKGTDFTGFFADEEEEIEKLVLKQIEAE